MNKYRNKKVEFDGYIFDSIKEKNRYVELKMLQDRGYIKNLKIKPLYKLIPGNDKFRSIKYEADFSYDSEYGFRCEWEFIVEDVKPDYKNYTAERNYKKTAAYQMFLVKKKLMYHVHGIIVREV